MDTALFPDRPEAIFGAPGRLDVGLPVAVIDIGSNSVRLVVYEGATRALTPIYNEKLMCGLGREVASTGRLSEEAVERALQALARFRVLCDTMHVERVHVLATAAARDAANGPAFLAAAAEACGCPVELLSGAREAELSADGVISGMHRPDGLVGDMGGGSLELVEVAGRRIGVGISLPLGGLALHDLSGGSLKKAARIVVDALADSPNLQLLTGRTFYAVGGTWRALARLHMAQRDYPLKVMHGYEIDPADAGGLLQLAERKGGPGSKALESVAESRRPLLAYGALLLDAIVRIGRPAKILSSAFGVREGFLFDRLPEAEKDRDPLISAAAELNLLRSRSPQHGEDLQDWTDGFIRTLGLPETETERRLRHAACLLADVGWRAHPDYRGEQSIAMIAHAAFGGIDHPGRAYLALAVYFRHEGLSLDSVSARLRTLATTELLFDARLLGALLRVAYPVSAAMGGVLPHTPLTVENDRIVLRLPQSRASLASERLLGRLRQLSKLVNMDASIRIG